MNILNKSSEDEMIALFLKEELRSIRFKDKLLKVIKIFKIDKDVIYYHDIENGIENKIRKAILKEYRGYGNNTGLFENFPKNIEWFWVELSIEDIKKIKYIDYDYWIELTNGTRLAKDSKNNILKGIEIYGISNQGFVDGAKYLKEGNTFEPIILLASIENMNEMVVLEGHSRLTCMNLVPECIDRVLSLVGFVKREELFKWNKY